MSSTDIDFDKIIDYLRAGEYREAQSISDGLFLFVDETINLIICDHSKLSMHKENLLKNQVDIGILCAAGWGAKDIAIIDSIHKKEDQYEFDISIILAELESIGLEFDYQQPRLLFPNYIIPIGDTKLFLKMNGTLDDKPWTWEDEKL